VQRTETAGQKDLQGGRRAGVGALCDFQGFDKLHKK
jgi:hypothetical protein